MNEGKVMSEGVDDIVQAVNAELATSRAMFRDDKAMASDSAQEEFLELIIYGNKVPAVAKFLRYFFNTRSAVIVCSVYSLMTEGAMEEVLHYDLEESMKRVLLACRAGDFVSWNFEGLDRHDGKPFSV